MTLPAALFGTAVRMSRTAAGRRALQLALLVGGLFMLGFLCGQQAHAAEGSPVAPVRSVRLAAGQESASGETVRGASEGAVQGASGRAVRSAAPDAVRDVARGEVRTVTERAVTPVRDVVRTASQGIEETRAKAPPLPAAPSVSLSELPEVSGLPAVPAPAPVGPEPRSPRPGGAAPAPGHGDHRTAGAGAGARDAVPARPQALVYGPDLVPGAPQLPAHTPAHRAAAPVGAPARPAPAGDSDGVLGKQAADGTASRHGDAHAVTLDGRAPLRLLPGTAARVDAPGPLERHRDIPVFPG
ncbi:hypothetical protein J2Z21_002440 [Streptomyces griseochromogenes]|uniref:Uncharacterized protein n=1 Tax=Streptomyces griseochromogenes TaxID=68214 RepID=A0A1B1AQX6_9ACTN|nr:hypothetical protein [Streptomyces griseochromogenes]ANP48979.1 hypothetical protein AVL59_04785 [Streptomyces griseochromogenes]MBP2049509.1 hypothetical protein [Streptomyces griseochromogenes]